MGEGGYVTLTNDTDRIWTRTHQHSYQMDWDFPERIPAGTQCKVYVEWHTGPFTTSGDDGAEARYMLDGTSIGFEVQARAANGFTIQIMPINLPLPGNPSGNVVEIGWKHDGVVRFALQGGAADLRMSTKDVWADIALTDWMNHLKGSTRLSELAIPGTHDTCARDCTAMSCTQTMTVRQQLDAGIRFLDIRCRHVGNAFAIHHGREFLNQWFEQVRDASYAFLDAHPRETIIMSVKQEHDDADNTRTYAQTLDAYIGATKSRWYLGDQIVSLDDVRGKIVLFRRFPADTTPLGIDAASDWQDDATFAITRNGVTLRIQDGYEVRTMFDVSAKWDRVKEYFDKAVQASSAEWFINFSSGGSAFAYPESVAKGTPGFTGVNDNLRRYLDGNTRGRYGTILMDFPEYPDDALIRTIISSNKRSG